jgi:hypothetical protein
MIAYILITRCESYKKLELLTLREHLSSYLVSWLGPCCSFSKQVFCIVLLSVFMLRVPCRDVLYVFRMKTMFDSSLPPVVCRRAHVLLTLFVFVCVQWSLTHIVLFFCFDFLRLVSYMLPVSLDCPFLIALSVFSNVYLVVHIIIEKISHANNGTCMYVWGILVAQF